MASSLAPWLFSRGFGLEPKVGPNLDRPRTVQVYLGYMGGSSSFEENIQSPNLVPIVVSNPDMVFEP